LRAVVQRSQSSRVLVEGKEIGSIRAGLVVLLGIKKGDGLREADYLMEKIMHLRIFADSEGKMNCSLLDTGGQVLLISQFTLYGDARRGRRPDFTSAELPQPAEELFDYCVRYLRDRGIDVATGSFGADMLVSIENDGPCTILLESDKSF